MKTTQIRKRIKKKLVDLDLDAIGQKKKIAEIISINYNMVIMALSGYRETPASLDILNKIEEYLDALKAVKAA